MSLKSGLAASVAWAIESTPGTAVTVTESVPFVSESLKQEIARVESKAIIAGARTMRSSQWSPGDIKVGGDVQLELFDRGLLDIFELMFGSLTGTGPYVATAGDMSGLAATFQVGRPDVAGTINPFTYAGCKVASWEIAGKTNELGTLGLTLVGMTETTATGLASPAPPSLLRGMSYVHGAIKVAGSTARVKSFKIAGNNGLNESRRFIGSQTILEPLEAKLRKYDGSLEGEFENLTAYNRFVNGTEAALQVVYANAVGTHSVTIDTNVRFDGETPNVKGGEILPQQLPFTCVSPTDDASAITVTIVAPAGS